MRKILFCIPHAGGTSNAYQAFKQNIISNETGSDSLKYEMDIIEMRGHGNRYLEQPYDSLAELVEEIYHYIISKIEYETEYAICGHSMGAYIAYFVYEKMRQQGECLPFHLFFSACNPRVVLKNLTVTEIEKNNLELQNMSVTSITYQKLLLPVLERDLRLLQKSNIRFEQSIGCEFSVLWGNDDDIAPKGSGQDVWDALAEEKVSYNIFSGNHMFLYQNRETWKYIDDVMRRR